MDKHNFYIVPIKEAKRFMVDCFKAVGTCDEHANIAAENLLQADYRGHYSHGMNRLSYYINDIISGTLKPNAVPSIEKETVAIALVNGNNGLGAVIGKYCMDLAIKKAKDVGIGMVTAHGSNHYGIAGIYALQAIDQGCIGISVTNTSPVMVPTRAKQQSLGSDPIAVGAPALNGDSLVVDMATTTVALGKLEVCKRKNETLPECWALNEEGKIETDPDKALRAQRLMPLGGVEHTGGYKGYGLAMAVETLSGILSGANFGPLIPVWSENSRISAPNLGQAFIAINPEFFAPGFSNRLGELLDYIRSMEPSDPERPVLIPGDPERNHIKQVDLQGGISYVSSQCESNSSLAKKLNVLPVKFSEEKKTST